MKKNLLIQEIKILQNEYRELLAKLLVYIEKDSILVALDEIVVFWMRHMDLVQLFLRSHAIHNQCYIFTAATYMDIADKENYPFMLLGDLHIMDDPLGRYCELCTKMQKDEISTEFWQQIVLTAKDDIRIIEECFGYIYVLPIRLINQLSDIKELMRISEQAFVNLFQDINSLKEYFSLCETFDDVIEHLRDKAENVILLGNNDNKELSIKERLHNSISDMPHLFNGNYSESFMFYQIVFGGIQQAVDVLLTCMEYKMIPLIRYKVVLNYFLLLADNFRDVDKADELKYKTCITHLIYQICDKEKLSRKGFKHFISTIQEIEFGKTVFIELKTRVSFTDRLNFSVILPIIEEKLNELYNVM